MIRGFWNRTRQSSATTTVTTLDRAAKPVIEALEGRVLMSGDGTDRHSFMGVQLAPDTVVSGGKKAHTHASKQTVALRPSLRGQNGFNWAGNQGWTVNQIRHLYGLDTLDAPVLSAPLYTNTGDAQNIAIIGSDPGIVLFSHFTGTGPFTRVPGNLERFNAAMGISTVAGSVFVDDTLAPKGGIPTPAPGPGAGINGDTVILDREGQDYTQGLVQWVEAMANQANIIVVDIPTSFGVASNANVLLGIQQAINNLAPLGGGVLLIPFTTNAEDPTIQAQYDALFAQAAAANISFVAAAGDNAGVISMPAASPYVTSVGGTVIQMDAAGNRNNELAWVRAGGGQSTTEGLPAYQVGIVPTRKGHKSRRGTPDISVAAIGRATGYGYIADDSLDGTSNFPWRYTASTSFSAAVVAGMVADANELRFTTRQELIGRELNKQIYNAFTIAPKFSFTDITLGNNTHQAGIGYDFATGLGVPKANGLIPSLGGVVGANGVNTKLTAQYFFSINDASGLNLVVPWTGTGSASFGPFDVGLGFTLTSPGNPFNTGTINIPLLSRRLDGTVDGQGTATLHIVRDNGDGTFSTTNTTVPILFSGTIGRAHRRYVINGSFVTIDANGEVVRAPGTTPAFQGTFKSF